MAYTNTLLQLRTSLLIRGQWEGSDDITPVVANEVLNDAIEEAYDILVGKWADYYTIMVPQVLTAGVDTYALPTDFYKLRKIEILISGTQYGRLYPVDLEASHEFYVTTGKRIKYRLQARSLIFAPPPNAENLRIYYIPIAQQLVNDADVITFDVPIERKLILAIARRDCLDRQDLDTGAIDVLIEKLTAKVRTAADSRDASEPFYLNPRGPDGDDEEEDY